MLQKFLLLTIIAILGFVIFMMDKISKTIKHLDLSTLPQEVPVQSKVSEAQSIPLPLIWMDKDASIKKVFLSYDPSDFSSAIEISKLLEKDGMISVYLSPKERNSLKGDDETMNALNTMNAFVILLSGNYEKSEIANQEYGVAIARGASVVVVSPFQMLQNENKYTDKTIQITPENQEKIGEIVITSLNSEVKKKVDEIELELK